MNTAETGLGEECAAVWPELYDELRALAAVHLGLERPGHTLQPTALVHEVFLKFAKLNRCRISDRVAFLAAAAVTMRRFLVDHARGKKSQKRGGPSAQAVPLDTTMLVANRGSVQIDELDEALRQLGAIEPRLAQVVELRFFAGMTEAEAAEALKVSRRTVQEDWRTAKAWLHRELAA
ncbi:MAG TPA: ECF-type sigma factor [Phycisphaerae bacterium]|nr:ECF-type sigma factor [Phycisphaerae bacterium]